MGKARYLLNIVYMHLNVRIIPFPFSFLWVIVKGKNKVDDLYLPLFIKNLQDINITYSKSLV